MIFDHLDKKIYANNPLLLVNTDSIKEFILYSNHINDKCEVNMTFERIPYNYYLACRMKNGKYNIYNIYSFLPLENSKLPKEINAENLPKDLDFITGIKEFPKDMFKIEKSGLCAYFPISKTVRYKKAEDFRGNFARFELPNGKKGWIDLEGNEYLDE